MSFSDPTDYALSSALETRERRRQGLSTAAGVVAATGGAVALIPAPPWTQIAGAGLAVLGAGMAVAARLRERGSRALKGDAAAVSGFARRAARWSSRRRGRVAEKLFKQLQRKKGRRQTVRRATDVALLKLKLGVLYGLEHGARKDKRRPLIRGETATAPEQVEADPQADIDQPDDADDGIPDWALPVGALAVAGVVAVLASKRKGS